MAEAERVWMVENKKENTKERATGTQKKGKYWILSIMSSQKNLVLYSTYHILYPMLPVHTPQLSLSLSLSLSPHSNLILQHESTHGRSVTTPIEDPSHDHDLPSRDKEQRGRQTTTRWTGAGTNE